MAKHLVSAIKSKVAQTQHFLTRVSKRGSSGRFITPSEKTRVPLIISGEPDTTGTGDILVVPPEINSWRKYQRY